MNDHTRDFRRDDCIVGVWRVTYKTLVRWYVCRECGGLPVQHIGVEDGETVYWAECGDCGYRDFITSRHFQRQLLDYDVITSNLPEELRALLPQREKPEMTAAEAVMDLFEDY